MPALGQQMGPEPRFGQALGRVKWGCAPRNAPVGLAEPLLASPNGCGEKKVTFKSKILLLFISTSIYFGVLFL